LINIISNESSHLNFDAVDAVGFVVVIMCISDVVKNDIADNIVDLQLYGSILRFL
jgi:hypothetical protein